MKQYFSYPLEKLNEYEKVKEAMALGSSVQVTGCEAAGLSHMIAGLNEGYKQKVIVSFDALKAQEIYEDLKSFGVDAVLYPSKDLIFFSADVHGSLIQKQRLEFIQKVVKGEEFTVVLTVDAFLDKIMPLKEIKKHFTLIETGEQISIDDLRTKFVEMGYESVDQIESPGQFSVRGSIVDVYTLTDETPFRIDFFDEEIEEIKSFDVDTQRSIEKIDSIKIYPANEYILDEKQIEKGTKKIREELEKRMDELDDEEANRLRYTTEEFLTAVDIDPTSPAYDSYVNFFFNNLVSLLDYFEDPVFFIDEPNRVAEKLSSISMEFAESTSNRLAKGYVLPGQIDIIWDKEDILRKINKNAKVMFTTIAQKAKAFDVDIQVEMESKNVHSYNGHFEMLLKDLENYKKRGFAVLITTNSATRGKRIASELLDQGLNSYFVDQNEITDKVPQEKEVMIVKDRLKAGFVYPLIKYAVITDTDIFGERRRRGRKKSTYKGSVISGFADLSVGDYVVHENHGLGIYRGIEEVEVEDIKKDYIKIEYANNSFLYVPATQLDVIQKYADAEAKPPKLNKLGGQEWSRTKGKVKKAVDEIADELVELYAERDNGTGFRFSSDNEWQREFEELFTHEETDDQLEAIKEVKKDMQSTKIMDRLICGDVGFGKTEVALRAAFKAVQDGKQVAYLVPTTVLAQQHYKTFSQRFKNFPVRVEMLSRFRTKASINQTIKDLKSGTVEIVIGTHRLLSKDVKFKDLGLLIIDEEQRFGVKHKEKIKELKTSVDVITLTATPIPRTLHMSLIGVRDMCIMTEAPQDRMPIQTFVMEYNDETVRDAINRELYRKGQVFYVYNRIETIANMAARIQKAVPHARVAYAHGQMSERQLEDIMYDFVNGDIDVLVSTTIIETGLDIPNANTIIIHNAEKMGLSQLYQLRGRVGRSNRNAYAFMMYSREKVLSEVAEKRLSAIRSFTDLGSGVKIAMRDLEIRGAGNILGASQSGHMGEVGYDLYCKLLEEAISIKKGNKPKEDFETKIDINVDAFVPPTYITNESLKMDIYKRIASIESQEEYEDMQNELVDRFGDIPTQVDNLMQVVLIKHAAHENFITEIKGSKKEITMYMWPEAKIDVERIPILVREYRGKLKFVPDDNCFIYEPEDKSKDLIEIVRDVVEDLSTLKG